MDANNPVNKLLDLLCFTPFGLIALVGLLVLPLVPPFNQEYLIRWLISAAFIASLAVAFDFTAGLINIVNFGFCAIMGVGGYTSAILAERIGLSPWLGMLAGGVTAAILGLVIGMITLRLRGIFAACLAWFFGLAAIAGAGLLFMYPAYPAVGLEPLYMAWFVVILSGLGNVLGAVMGAFMVALLKVLTVEYIGSGWDFVVPSALIILILIFKPSGIFGSEVRGVLDK